jgi:REP element-mobilizing transposase RayT
MALKQRRPAKAGAYHIIVRSPTPEPFFRDGDDRLEFLSVLRRVTNHPDTEMTCLCVCLMTTHYHLLVVAGVGALPDAMQRINWRYAFDFNRKYGHRGHHVGGKYLSIPVTSDAQLVACYRYIVLNPVRAGLVERAEDWPWSSYAAAIGEAPGYEFVDPSPVLNVFSESRELAVQRLRGFVEAPRIGSYKLGFRDEVPDTWGARSVGQWA